MLELPALPIIRMHVLLQIEGGIPMSSFPEATIRGGLGYYLRSGTCLVPTRDCSDCPLQKSCLFANLFEPENGKSETKSPRPKPWAIFAKECAKGMDLEVSFFGNYAMMLKPFLDALSRLGEAGIGAHGVRFAVKGFSEPQRILLGDISFATSSFQTLNIYTPMSLRLDGKRLSCWNTKAFASTLLRRIYALSAFAEIPIPASWNYRELLDEFFLVDAKFETHSTQRTRFSTHQNVKLEYPGFEGIVRLNGINETVARLLAVGSVIGVGKNTVFGFGKYEVIA